MLKVKKTAELKSVFDEFDSDKDGKISAEELGAAIQGCKSFAVLRDRFAAF